MSDKKIALEITKLHFNKENGIYCSYHYTDFYNKVLKELREFNDTFVKIDNLISEYDKRITTSEYIMNKLIDNIRNLLKGGVDNE